MWYILFWLALAPFVFYLMGYGIKWAFAEAGVLWTFRGRNQLIVLEKEPGNPYGVLGINAANDEKFMTGIEWMGLPPIHVHEFEMTHRRLNQEITPETKHTEWIKTDPEPEKTRYLLRTVTHWAYVPQVEFKGGQQADILFQFQASIKSERGARIAVYDRGGKFYEALNGVVESNIISDPSIRKRSYDTFMASEKDSNSPFIMGTPAKGRIPAKKGLLWEINRTAEDISGYTLDSIFVFRIEPSTPADAELSRAKKAAQIHMEAAKLEAQGQVADITELIRLIKEALPHASEDNILQEVSKLGIAKRFAESKNLQAVGGTMLGLGNQKKGRSK